MAEDYVLQTKITADSTSFDKGIKSAQNSLKGLSSSISSAIKLAGGLFAIGSIAQLGKALSDMSQSYAKATQNIVRGTGAVGEQLKTLQKSVNASLINGVGRDASELGEMVADLNTRLGVTGDTLTELVSQFDDFSNVTGTDTKTAINSVSDVLAKWNIETSQTVPLLDQLTYASQASGASVTDLTNGLKSGQAVFSQFGMSATESIAFLGTLKKNGIDTSSAIMGMKTALANFAKSGLDAKTAFAEISESIKNAGSQTEALSIATQAFGQRSGAEFVRILSGGTDGVNAFTEALENAGGSLARTNEASRTSADAMRDLKATIAGVFSTSGTDNGLRDLIDDIARAIRNLDFTSIKETFSNIGLFIKGVWEQVKELFNNLSGAVDVTSGNFKIFADIIYQYLNNAYQVIQDFVGMISAVLNGDWSVAWEYAKLIVLRTVKQMEDSVNNAIKLMPNLFNSVIEGYNWVLEQQDKLFLDIFHLPEKYFKSAKLPKFEGKNIIDTKSIDEAIEKARKTIESKTGKIADNTLKDLKRQKEAVHATTQAITGDIGSLGTAVEDTTETIGTKITGFFAKWGKQYEDLAGDWTKTFVDMANIGTDTMGDMFQQLGQDLVDGGIGFENYSAVAVQAISQVLVALSAQISALGVTHALTMDFAGAALAAAGAAAALAAAGALGAVAKNMRSTAEETSAVTSALEEFIKLLNELRSGKLTSSEFASSFVSLRKIVKDTNDYLYKSVELFANVQEKYSKFYDVVDWKSNEDMATLRELEDTLEDVTDNLYLASVKQSLALASYNTLLAETVENQKKEIASGKELSDMYETLYSDINKFYELLRNEQMIQVQGLRTSLLESMASLGADIGKMLTDGIKSGASKSDFAESLKELIREKMIEIAVYTEQFQNILADAGTKLMSGIAGGDDSLIQQAKEQIEALYDTAVQTAEIVDKKLSSIFKSIKNTAKSATSSIAESMKSISESAVTSLRNLAGSQKQINSLLTSLKAQSKSWESVKSVSTSLLKSSANSAKTTLESARKNLETQQKALDNASKKLNDANAKLATAQQNLALSPYYGDLGVAIASRAYNQALLEQTAALKKYEEAEQKKNEAQQRSNSAQLAYNNALSAYEEKLAEVNPYLSQINEAENKYNSLISETRKQLSNENASLKAQIEAYRDLLTAQKDTVGFNTQLVNVRNQVLGIYDELSASALSLGESLVNAIANGMNKKDFSLELKDYIRQNIIKLNVYSGELGNRIATAGERLTAAIISQDNAGIKNAKSHMMTAYNEIDSLMKNIDKQLDDIFGVAKKTEESVSSFQRAINSFKDSITDLGGDVANNLISSLSNGLDADSALVGFKKFLREYIIKAYVFTESMKGEIEKIGSLIGKTLDGSVSKNELSNVANAVKATYGKLANSMKTVDTLLDSVFGKEAEKEIKDTGSTIKKELSKIENAMKSFKETISDLGGDIASNLIDGLSNGLSQSDFLSNMKGWIKKMLVQSVVYTEQMKSEIEAIGKTISNAISGGFTETSMHEIRRDLSFIFEQASSKMSGIDKILGGVFDGYASGTENATKGLHIVGESGPELIKFKGGERVYNNADTMRMIAGAGKTNNFNVTFNNLRDTSAFAMMNQLKQYNRELAINGVI